MKYSLIIEIILCIRAQAKHYSRRERKREKINTYNFENLNLFRVKLVYYSK